MLLRGSGVGVAVVGAGFGEAAGLGCGVGGRALGDGEASAGAGVSGAGVAAGVTVALGTGAGVVCEGGGVRVQAKPITASETVRMSHGAIAESGARRRGFFLRDTNVGFAPSRAHHCFRRCTRRTADVDRDRIRENSLGARSAEPVARGAAPQSSNGAVLRRRQRANAGGAARALDVGDC
jgi:hypothetical protein